MFVELVMKVRSVRGARALATCHVVVPAPSATTLPGETRAMKYWLFYAGPENYRSEDGERQFTGELVGSSAPEVNWRGSCRW